MHYNIILSQDEVDFLKAKKIVRNNIIKYKSDLVYKLDKYCLIYKTSFSELIFIIINNIKREPKCLNCNTNKPKFVSKSIGFKKYCSTKCSNSHYLVKDKKESVYLSNYGVNNPSKSKEIKEKLSIIGKSQTEETRRKRKETCLSKWGFETNLNLPEVKEKAKISLSKKEVKEKRKKTCQSNWGYESVFSSDIIKNKISNTNIKKYGYKYPLQSEVVKEKAKNTNLEKYGFDNPSKNIDVKKKRKETFYKNWGVDHPTKNEVIKDKIKATTIENWGVDYPMKSNIIKEKTRITNLEKWGSKNNTSSELFRKENFEISKDPRYIKYLGDGISLFLCKEGHVFELSSDIYSHRNKYHLCHICKPKNKSIKEIDLYNYIKSIYNDEVIQSYRDVLEIDIYLPNLKLGFEFNGLYWHSELFKDKNYHLNKTNYFKEKGIRIIHIWEDDWTYKRDIIESQISNWLGLTKNRIFARNCEIREVKYTKKDMSFLGKNHVQGKDRSNIKLGLCYKDELVSLMTFDKFEGRKKMGIDEWNLSRFCNKLGYNVVGGASKLLNYFIKNYKPTRIISYADNDWSIGGLYNKLGFNMVSVAKPDYKYIIEERRTHKSRFRKTRLNTNLTESSEMNNRNVLKIYDSGKIKFQMKL